MVQATHSISLLNSPNQLIKSLEYIEVPNCLKLLKVLYLEKGALTLYYKENDRLKLFSTKIDIYSENLVDFTYYDQNLYLIFRNGKIKKVERILNRKDEIIMEEESSIIS